MSREIGPELTLLAGFLAGPAGMLLHQLADVADERVSTGLAQAETIRAVLDDTGRLMDPTSVGALETMTPSPPSTPNDYHVGRLSQYLADLDAALVFAHTWLEASGSVAAMRIVERIWDHLLDRAKRESRLIPPMW